MKFLPSLDVNDESDQMDKRQDIIVICLVYISVLFYSALLVLELHNLYRYLYLQKKFQVFPLTLFYTLSIPCTILRIYGNIWVVEVVKYQQLSITITLAFIKLCLGFT